METLNSTNLTIDTIDLILTGVMLLVLWWTLKETKRIAQASLDQTEYLTRPVIGMQKIDYSQNDPKEILLGRSEFGRIVFVLENLSSTDAIGLLQIHFKDEKSDYLPKDSAFIGKDKFFFAAKSTKQFDLDMDRVDWKNDKPVQSAKMYISIFYKTWSTSEKNRKSAKRYISPPRVFHLVLEEDCYEIAAETLSVDHLTPNWELLEK